MKEIFSKSLHRNLKEEKTYFTQFFSTEPVFHFDMKAARESSRLIGPVYKRGTPMGWIDAGFSWCNLELAGKSIPVELHHPFGHEILIGREKFGSHIRERKKQ
ncbi:MAG: hypothetical protein D6733_06470 [Methanobacteriota archaeon]|nr:MAG: hypothetical protein D6733_06470 [Euryarchaeota archaeon]